MAARKTSHVRVVAPNETSAPKVRTILEAAESGTRRDELLAMRRRIARALDDPNTPARDLAALSRRQLEIGREVEAIDAAAEQEAAEDAEVADEAFDAEAL